MPHWLWLSCWTAVPSQLQAEDNPLLWGLWDAPALPAASLLERINSSELEKSHSARTNAGGSASSRLIGSLSQNLSSWVGVAQNWQQCLKFLPPAKGQTWDLHRYLNSLQQSGPEFTTENTHFSFSHYKKPTEETFLCNWTLARISKHKLNIYQHRKHPFILCVCLVILFVWEIAWKASIANLGLSTTAETHAN